MDDAQWVSLMLVMQQILHAWKQDEAALRRFVVAALWICRTGAPWCDLIFEALRPSLPADGLAAARQHHLQGTPWRERRYRPFGDRRSAQPQPRRAAPSIPHPSGA